MLERFNLFDAEVADIDDLYTSRLGFDLQHILDVWLAAEPIDQQRKTTSFIALTFLSSNYPFFALSANRDRPRLIASASSVSCDGRSKTAAANEPRIPLPGPILVVECAPQERGADHVHTMYRDPSNDYGSTFAGR